MTAYLLVLRAAVLSALAAVMAAGAQPRDPLEAERKLRVLSLMTVDTVSHHKFMAPLTIGLAERGHYVHSVDVQMPERRPPTLNVTVMDNAFKVLERVATLQKNAEKDWVPAARALANYNLKECEDDFATPALKALLDPGFNETFDIILVDYIGSDCFLGFAHRFNYPPLVVVSPFPGSYWIDMLMGNPLLPAVSPMFFLPYKTPMSFLQRLVTTVCSILLRIHTHMYVEPNMNLIVRDLFGPSVPTVAELRKNVSLALVNEVPWVLSPRPFPQSTVAVGGMHIQPANLSNIPADLRKWLDDAEDGFILVSFGSVMKSSNMDDQKREAFLGAFAQIKPRVLWKFEDESIKQHLSPNVRIEKWLPQNDIMGHPHLLLFVSHCGGLSMLEMMYHAVPVLGVPFIVDQFLNAQRIQDVGMGRKLLQEEITKARFAAELQEMINNPVYREGAQRQSQLLRDQRESPLERAVWWVEYVARHGGTPHLRSPALALEWYQEMLLDVYAALAAAVTAGLALSSLCLRIALRKCCSASRARGQGRPKQD